MATTAFLKLLHANGCPKHISNGL